MSGSFYLFFGLKKKVFYFKDSLLCICFLSSLGSYCVLFVACWHLVAMRWSPGFSFNDDVLSLIVCFTPWWKPSTADTHWCVFKVSLVIKGFLIPPYYESAWIFICLYSVWEGKPTSFMDCMDRIPLSWMPIDSGDI